MQTLMRRHVLGAGMALMVLPALAQRHRSPDQYFFESLLGDLRQELQSARDKGRKGVLLVYEMQDCPFCVRFHDTVLRDAAVQDWYRQRFVIFRIDVRGANPIVGFDGRELSESAFAAAQRVRATPTSVFYGLDGNEQARFAGLPRDIAEFIRLGEFVLSGDWRHMTFAQFKGRTP